MKKPAPRIQQFMTTSPHTIGRDQTLEAAHVLMREHRIRHLPVLDGGIIVGLLSLSDLRLIESLKDVDPREVLVEDAMTEGPYTVSPEASLDEVAGELAERKIGSAVVVQHGRPVGIFTTTDALRALRELLRGSPAR